ncbi:MAG TPA: MobF family relaxase [Mycobacteriales bacterium]|nr:MobF family relaxase [Mycobacteriales bacterium]
MVISVETLSGSDPAAYYLQREVGCEAGYYLDRAEPTGRWVGDGAAALALTGPLDETGEAAFRRMLAGQHPLTGEQLAKPVWRPVPSGRLPGRPLVEAIRRVARDRGVPEPAALFPDETLADAFRGITAAADRRPFTRSLDPRVGQRLGAAVGLDPVELYRGDDGADVFGRALEHAAEREDARNGGYDVCVSAPKSVSTLWALAGPEIGAAVQAAHAAAVGAALGYLQRASGHGLRGHQGHGQRASRMGTDGFIGAAFDHHTSRANDPQLHTHIVIANLLHGRDGKWTAIDSRTLFRHATTASYLYHAVLRGELTTSLGVVWTPVTRGIAEVRGIPADLIHDLSTRHNEIDNYLAASGRDDPGAAQYACLATRPAKDPKPPGELRVTWQQAARRLGYDADQLVAASLDHGPAAAINKALLAATLTGPRGLTRHKTKVDERDLIQALCDALPAGTPVTLDSIDRLAREIAAGPGVVSLLPSAGDLGPTMSTIELATTEQHALSVAAQLRQTSATYPTGRFPPLDRLTDEQRRLALRLVFPDSCLDVIVGPAGSGKTSALAAAYRSWHADQIPVIGTAVAALAARGLQTRTGIPSVTLTKLLGDLDQINPRTRRPAGFAPGTVVVVDEASMVDTRSYARLLDHVWRSGARIALVGDTEQLPEIEAGGLFATVAADPSAIRLTTNVRQGETWERDALTALRENRPATALLAYLDHGRIHVDEPRLLPAAISATYASSAASDPLGTVALASTRREVAALNTVIRGRLRRDGYVGTDGVTVRTPSGTTEFATGDIVVVTRNRRDLGVLNGMRGQVTNTDPRSRSVVMVDDLGESHALPAELLASGVVQHGYALTIHRAQGITVDTALVYGTAALSKESGYVALSRGRIANHLFVSPDDVHDAMADQPWGGQDRHDLLTAVDLIAMRLELSRHQRLATSYLPQRHPLDPYEITRQPTREMRGLSR